MSTPATAIAIHIRAMSNARVIVDPVAEPQPDPGHEVGASAAWIARSSGDASSSMIDATVANRDPVPSRALRVFSWSALPPTRSKAASYELGGTSPEPRGVSPPAPPDAVGLPPGGAEGVPGADVVEGFGIGDDVCVGDPVGSGLGDGEGDGSGEGSDDGEGSGDGESGEGFGDFVGFGGFEGFGALSAGTGVVVRVSSTEGSVFAAIADDTALRVRAIVKSAIALVWRTPLLRRLVELPAT
jgi:hypothetical protein